jgi:ribonuclease P protein component
MPIRYTFKKHERLRHTRDFKRVRAEGRPYYSPLLTVRILTKQDESPPRLGIVVGRHVGNAVARNRIKRLAREVFRLNKHRLQRGCDIVVTPKPAAAGKTLRDLEEILLHAMRGAGIMT